MVNPVAVIVGGTRGIGLAMGKQWLQNQSNSSAIPRLFLLGRNVNTRQNEALKTLIEEHKQSEIHPVAVNLLDPTSVHSAASIVASKTETIDYLFHTAGLLHNFDSSGKIIDGKPLLPERAFKEMTLEGMHLPKKEKIKMRTKKTTLI